MKKLILPLVLSLSVVACNSSKETETSASDMTSPQPEPSTLVSTANGDYIDLKTGEKVTFNASRGRYVDAAGMPVDFYVNAGSNDTFYGANGQNVNNGLIREGDIWRVDETRIKIKDDKIKMTDDAGNKVKIDEDGIKVKDANGNKTKLDNDGNVKTKDGHTTIKADEDGVKVK